MSSGLRRLGAEDVIPQAEEAKLGTDVHDMIQGMLGLPSESGPEAGRYKYKGKIGGKGVYGRVDVPLDMNLGAIDIKPVKH